VRDGQGLCCSSQISLVARCKEKEAGVGRICVYDGVDLRTEWKK
jgi:hypothetical protein